MKKIFITLLVFASSFPLYADSGKKSAIPNDYKLVGSRNSEISGSKKSDTFVKCDSSIQQMIASIQSGQNLDNLCSDIITDIKIISSSDIENDSYYVIRLSVDHIKTMKVSIYCKPRNFSDSALVSLFQKCQDSPQAECFNPELITQLNQVKNTTYSTKTSGSCR